MIDLTEELRIAREWPQFPKTAPEFAQQFNADLSARAYYQPCLEALLAIKQLCQVEVDRYGGHAHEAGRASMASDVLSIIERLK